MAWYEIWKSPTIIQQLNKHLAGMTHEQKIEALKAIVKEVCDGVNVSKNPVRKKAPDTSGEGRNLLIKHI